MNRGAIKAGKAEVYIGANIKELVGKNGMAKILKYEETTTPKSRFNYRFIDPAMPNIFLYENISN